MRYPMLLILAIFFVPASSLRAAKLEAPASGSGMGFMYPIEPITKKFADRCRDLSAEERSRTHVFVINGLDPMHIANLNGFCHSVRGIGFPNVWYGELTDRYEIEKKVIAVRVKDPSAKVVLVGYSLGANEVRSICNSLKEKRIGVDLLVYFGGDQIMDGARSRPANAARILNIRGYGCLAVAGNFFINGDDIKGARNIRLRKSHFAIPSRSETMEAFLDELCDVARATPIRPAITLGEPVPIKDP